MSYLQEAGSGAASPSLSALRETLGFVPGIFRAQSLLPAVIGPEAALVGSVVSRDRSLSRLQKECILLIAAAALRNQYWLSAQYQSLQILGVPERQLDGIVADHEHAGLSPATAQLLGFARKLSGNGPSFGSQDVRGLMAAGIGSESILEAVVATALAGFLCTLSTGLGVAPDFGIRELPPVPVTDFPEAGAAAAKDSGPYIDMAAHIDPKSAEDCASLVLFRNAFGFVPNILTAQMPLPEILEAEWNLIQAILLSGGQLSGRQKACISIAVSAASFNTYGVALHTGIGRACGITADEADRIASDYGAVSLVPADAALLHFTAKLATQTSVSDPGEVSSLRLQGFSDAQILEAILTTSLTNFFDTLQFGLGVTPDFEPRRIFHAAPSKTAQSKIVHLPEPGTSPTSTDAGVHAGADQDSELVERVQAGDLDAFEKLIERHNRRVYRTLLGILGNADEASDAMQDTFLKAFRYIGSFEQRSKFSTWLLSIASNTAIQRIRERKNMESLDDSGFDSDEDFHPRQVQAWTDDPEKLYSQGEMRVLVEKGVMSLPAKYRVVVMLRDIEQFPIEEAAKALGLGIPAVKSRLLRGRLMLREALSPHFISSQGKPVERSAAV
jgi:RNA polymerase sigma-70 factor (ECF subfamily)